MSVGVLISGAGSNLKAIFDADIDVKFVCSDNINARGLHLAHYYGISVSTMPVIKKLESIILGSINTYQPKLLVCAGYMRLLSKDFLDKCPIPVINIHPSLLPSFPGKNAIQQTISSGVKITGVTVHYVDEGMDTGEIIDQQSCMVMTKDPQILKSKLQQIEHGIYPKIIKELLNDN